MNDTKLLLPYRLDLNPVEQVFAKLKTLLRKATEPSSTPENASEPCSIISRPPCAKLPSARRLCMPSNQRRHWQHATENLKPLQSEQHCNEAITDQRSAGAMSAGWLTPRVWPQNAVAPFVIRVHCNTKS
jgi:hypothetical protein